MQLHDLLFWRSKTPTDNEWRPQPPKHPTPFGRVDLQAAFVDTSPFVAGAGSLAHFRQINQLGWTVPASIFRNARTMLAMERTACVLPVLFMLCQAARVDYRTYIPRWCHDRERRRVETEVRGHVEVGGWIGVGVWIARTFVFRARSVNYPVPVLEVVMGMGLADLMHREYCKAHGL